MSDHVAIALRIINRCFKEVPAPTTRDIAGQLVEAFRNEWKPLWDQAILERNTARRAAGEYAQGPWIWADDETDDLGSMSDGMVITMTAGTLRRLLENLERELDGGPVFCDSCEAPAIASTLDHINGDRQDFCPEHEPHPKGLPDG